MEFTKEQLIEHLRSRIEHRKGLIASIHIDRGYSDYLKLELRSSEIALESLEAEAVGEFYHEARWGWYEISEGDSVPERARIPLYRVPPAPISVPAAMEMDDDFDSAFEHGKAVGWNACRAAMLQGAELSPATDNTAQQFEALGTSKAKPTAALKIPEGLHPDTADLVMRFATALAEKLHRAEQKYGYANGWKASGWYNECLQQLWEHIEKGDPRDVAAYCAFMWHHGWVTTDYDRGVQQALATSAGSGKP